MYTMFAFSMLLLLLKVIIHFHLIRMKGKKTMSASLMELAVYIYSNDTICRLGKAWSNGALFASFVAYMHEQLSSKKFWHCFIEQK